MHRKGWILFDEIGTRGVISSLKVSHWQNLLRQLISLLYENIKCIIRFVVKLTMVCIRQLSQSNFDKPFLSIFWCDLQQQNRWYWIWGHYENLMYFLWMVIKTLDCRCLIMSNSITTITAMIYYINLGG